VIYDISPTLSPALAVWPGDTPLSREVLQEMRDGDSLTLSTLHATVHLGAHADAPSHYGVDGYSIEARALEPYLGPCRVLRPAPPLSARLGPELLPEGLGAERVLFATGSYPDPNAFNRDFAALSPELIHELNRRGVKLVGVDTPSVDSFDSKELPTHKACLDHDMAILEGLVLEGVPEGLYELIALPLKLKGFDASPVRAILRSL
jgi:arylformamidase